MARPKSSIPPKQKLSLTVSEETRRELQSLSEYHGQSISALVAEWAKKEMEKISKTKGEMIK